MFLIPDTSYRHSHRSFTSHTHTHTVDGPVPLTPPYCRRFTEDTVLRGTSFAPKGYCVRSTDSGGLGGGPPSRRRQPPKAEARRFLTFETPLERRRSIQFCVRFQIIPVLIFRTQYAQFCVRLQIIPVLTFRTQYAQLCVRLQIIPVLTFRTQYVQICV